jgi:hypothetical protein
MEVFLFIFLLVVAGPLLLLALACVTGFISFFSPSEPEPPPTPIYTPITTAKTRTLFLSLPPSQIKPDLYIEIINALYYISTNLVLQLEVRPSSSRIAILCDEDKIPYIKSAIFGVSDSLDISDKYGIELDLDLDEFLRAADIGNGEAQYIAATINRNPNFEHFPLATIHDFKEVDPINNIIEAVMPLNSDQDFSLYIVLRAPSRSKLADIDEKIERLSYNNKPLYRKLHERYYNNHKFEALILAQFATSSKYSVTAKAQNVASILRSRFDAGHVGLHSSEWKTSTNPTPKISDQTDYFLITAPELAAIWHPFSNKVTAPGARFLKFPPTPLPESVTQSNGLPLGSHRQRGENVIARLPLRDLQLGHAILLGKTRVGKTTLGHQMARSIKSLLPESSLIILDPNGDWAIDYAKRSVSSQREHKTYLVEFGNTDFPPSLPILRPPKGISIDSFIKTTFETVKLIFRDKWSSSRMETVLFNTVAALAYYPKATLLDIEKLYTVSGFRRRVLSYVPDEQVQDYWRRFDEMSRTEQDKRVDPILSRISVFTRSRAIRNITCRTDAGFDIAELIEEGPSLPIVGETHDTA